MNQSVQDRAGFIFDSESDMKDAIRKAINEAIEQASLHCGTDGATFTIDHSLLVMNEGGRIEEFDWPYFTEGIPTEAKVVELISDVIKALGDDAKFSIFYDARCSIDESRYARAEDAEPTGEYAEVKLWQSH